MPIANIPNFHCCFQSYRHPSRASKTPRSSQHSDIIPPPAQNDYADCSCNCLDPTFKIRGCHHCLSERPVRHRKCWCTRKCPACPCILCNPKLYAAYSSCGLLIREKKMHNGVVGSFWQCLGSDWGDLVRLVVWNVKYVETEVAEGDMWGWWKWLFRQTIFHVRTVMLLGYSVAVWW